MVNQYVLGLKLGLRLRQVEGRALSATACRPCVLRELNPEICPVRWMLAAWLAEAAPLPVAIASMNCCKLPYVLAG